MRLEKLLNNHFGTLNDTDKSIVNFILNHQRAITHMSISELADKCLVSQSSVFRLTKKLGLTGFNQLKFILEEDQTNNQAQTETNFISLTTQAVNNVLRQFQSVKMDDVYSEFKKATEIYIYSTGWEQAIISEQLQRSFFLVGKNVLVLPAAADELEAMLNRMEKNNLLIVISYRGENEALIHNIESLSARGVATMALTPFRQNRLAQICDYKLYYTIVEKKVANNDRPEIFFTGLYVLNDLLIMGYSNYLNNKLKEGRSSTL